MKKITKYTSSLYEHLSETLENKAKELLYNGINEKCLVYTDGFSKRYLFENILIQTAHNLGITVVLNRDTKRIEMLRKRQCYAHIHNLETLKLNTKKNTPTKFIVSDNMTFKELNELDDCYELVGGFRNEYKDQKEQDIKDEKEWQELLNSIN